MTIVPKQCLFLGATYYVVEDADYYRAPLVPPKNYKDKVKIDEWMTKAAQERDKEAQAVPILSRVKELVVLDIKGSPVINYTSTAKTRPLRALADMVSYTEGLYLFGLDIDYTLANLWFEEVRAGGAAAGYNVFRPSCEIAFDPYRMIMRKFLDHVDLPGLMRFLQIPDVGANTAVGLASIARQLIMRCGFDLRFTHLE